MTRDATPYGQNAVRAVSVDGATDVSRPAEGYYRHKLRSGGVYCGIEIRYGAPLDPVTGEELDRSWRWQAFVNGQYESDWDRIWPGCTGDPISWEDYQNYCRRAEWAAKAAPDSAYADPRRKIDPFNRGEALPF